jgi:hypothetical protein
MSNTTGENWTASMANISSHNSVDLAGPALLGESPPVSESEYLITDDEGDDEDPVSSISLVNYLPF